MDNDDVIKLIDDVLDALDADLEHGVAWMNEEACDRFAMFYPRLNAELNKLGQTRHDLMYNHEAPPSDAATATGMYDPEGS